MERCSSSAVTVTSWARGTMAWKPSTLRQPSKKLTAGPRPQMTVGPVLVAAQLPTALFDFAPPRISAQFQA